METLSKPLSKVHKSSNKLNFWETNGLMVLTFEFQ
jgi:hypothetical protein